MMRGGFPAPRRHAVSAINSSVPFEPAGQAAGSNRLRQIARPALAIRDPNALTFFHYFAFLYVILYVSRFIEFLPGSLRPILLFSIVLIGGALISGRILALFDTAAGKWMGAFIFWLGITSVFSMWPKQSLMTTIDMIKVLMSGMVVVAYTTSARAAYGMLASTGFGLGLAGVYPFFAGGSILGDRMVVNATEGGSMADPNFFGMFLVIGIPLLTFCLLTFPKAAKLIPAALLPLALFSFMKTGSRSGMVAMVAMLIFVFLQVPGRQKAKMLVVAGVALAALIAVTPRNILLRYAWLIESDAASSRAQTQEEMEELSRAGGSAEGRKHLAKQALILTVRNPIVGVGANMFAEAEEAFAMNVQGMARGARHTTHNTFLQASAETGIPGFILFTAVTVIAFRNLSRIRRWCKANRHLPRAGAIEGWMLAMQASLVALYAEMMFLSVLYAGFAWLILSIAVGVAEAARREVARLALPAGPAQQTAPANVIKRPGVVLAENLAGVRKIPFQSGREQNVGPGAVRRVVGDRPIPRVGGGR